MKLITNPNAALIKKTQGCPLINVMTTIVQQIINRAVKHPP